MPRPDGGLIRETNLQYYAGAQIIYTSVQTQVFTFTFNTKLSMGSGSSWNPADSDFPLNNFRIYTSPNGLSNWTEYITTYTLTFSQDGAQTNSIITLGLNQGVGTYVKVQLKEGAVQNNYGGYEYISIKDIVNNFIVGYVGQDKLIPRVNRTDVIFHAKRGLQEFSYDTLKSIKSQELTVGPNLSVIIPQDYVNYVKLSWISGDGVKHTIYPTQLTSSPWEAPVQDAQGDIVQDNFGDNVDGTSLTNSRWQAANPDNITGLYPTNSNNPLLYMYDWWGEGAYGGFYGQRYGGDPVNMQMNGWFNIDEKRGTFNFSSDLANKLIILEYISDGLAYDENTKVPKMAEEAMYQHLLYSILSTRVATVQIAPQYKKQRYAALRNAKIRLSNIKLDEIAQVMRNKSKWIKH
jgi:hypothetical protein|tara:strand:+ start:530 stop:1747 length:1218 start_codon:yes stop_codon:yes gene_type:complete